MATHSTPFSHSELLPQEEMLEVKKSKGELFIGLPKEHSYQEKRVCLTPEAVADLTANGHRVLIERGAGKDASFSDKDYAEAGGELTADREKVYACPLILKVEPPTEEELEMMNPQTVLLSALQIKTRDKAYFQKLASKRITAIGFEYIQDDQHNYPVVTAMSEIAGTAAVLIASELLSGPNGEGVLFGNICGVPPLSIVILGAGTVGCFATRAAIGLGAVPKIFDQSLTRLRNLQSFVKHPVYTSTVHPYNLKKAIKRADVIIGAVRGENRSPVLLTEEMMKQMKSGSVFIDVSIDMGGCAETSEITSHDNPVIEKHGVLHYGVPNLPSKYARTSSISISNIFTPYLLHIGNEGGIENTLRFHRGLRSGLYFYHGILTNKSVADWFDMSYRDINLLIF